MSLQACFLSTEDRTRARAALSQLTAANLNLLLVCQVREFTRARGGRYGLASAGAPSHPHACAGAVIDIAAGGLLVTLQ